MRNFSLVGLLPAVAFLLAASDAHASQPAAATLLQTEENAGITPPSPIERLPADRGSGRARITAWMGWSVSSLRKDTVLLRGDDISFEQDLDAKEIFVAPKVCAEFKVRRRFYAFAEFAWMRQKSRATAPAGGLAFDGALFDPGSRLNADLTRFFVDFGLLAWGTVEEEYALAFAIGARYQSVAVSIASDSAEAFETTESVFPFLEARAELSLSSGVLFEASARFSLFTLTDRSINQYENTVFRYVDGEGNTVGETVYSSSHRYYNRTQVNGLAEVFAGISAAISKEASFYFGARLTYASADRFYPDRREYAGWFGIGIETGLDLKL